MAFSYHDDLGDIVSSVSLRTSADGGCRSLGDGLSLCSGHATTMPAEDNSGRRHGKEQKRGRGALNGREGFFLRT